jgi:hypothetical protein
MASDTDFPPIPKVKCPAIRTDRSMSDANTQSTTGKNMIGQNPPLTKSSELQLDPLPWLIHRLRVKQTDRRSTTPVNRPTEPVKDCN